MTLERDLVAPKPQSNRQAITRATTQADAGTVAQVGGQARPGTAARRRQLTKANAQGRSPITKGLSLLQAHDLVTEGLSVDVALALMAAFHVLDKDTVLRAMGISERTLQRAQTADKRLDPNASDRTLRLAAVTEQAADALGSWEAAERWLASPAMGLDQRRPIDLLQSSEGTELVKTLLTRMDYGVYA